MRYLSVLFLFVFFLIFSCSYKNSKNELSVFIDGSAKWIQDEKKLAKNDSLFYLDDPAPLFRKVFDVEKNIENAKLYITSAGYYLAFINQLHM